MREGEKKEYNLYGVDNITLYSDRIERWLIELCMCIICYKWDYLLIIINDGENVCSIEVNDNC